MAARNHGRNSSHRISEYSGLEVKSSKYQYKHRLFHSDKHALQRRLFWTTALKAL